MTKLYVLKSGPSKKVLKGFLALAILFAGLSIHAQEVSTDRLVIKRFAFDFETNTYIKNAFDLESGASENSGFDFVTSGHLVMTLKKEAMYVHSDEVHIAGNGMRFYNQNSYILGLGYFSGLKQINTSQNGLIIGPGYNPPSANGALHVIGADNTGQTAALTIESPNQRMLLDGNEIETVNTPLYVQLNSEFNISMVAGGGMVGIGLDGTTDPLEKLHMVGNFRLDDGLFLSNEAMRFRAAASGSDNNTFIFENNAEVEIMRIHKDGNVGIGTSAPTQKLEVEGTVKANSFVSSTSSFPDYVFEANYNMISLTELDGYVKKHKRLPNMPSEKEVVENGMDMTDVMVKSVENIENIYLHLIHMNERMEALERENTELKTLLNK